MERIHYRSGYKYQLAVSYTYTLRNGCHRIGPDYEDDFLAIAGVNLVIKSGYAWNGASGPTWDSKSSMRGSLVHDALYQLIQLGTLPQNQISPANSEFHLICRQDKMHPARAKAWLMAVELFGDRYAKEGSGLPTLTAP